MNTNIKVDCFWWFFLFNVINQRKLLWVVSILKPVALLFWSCTLVSIQKVQKKHCQPFLSNLKYAFYCSVWAIPVIQFWSYHIFIAVSCPSNSNVYLYAHNLNRMYAYCILLSSYVDLVSFEIHNHLSPTDRHFSHLHAAPRNIQENKCACACVPCVRDYWYGKDNEVDWMFNQQPNKMKRIHVHSSLPFACEKKKLKVDSKLSVCTYLYDDHSYTALLSNIVLCAKHRGIAIPMLTAVSDASDDGVIEEWVVLEFRL